MLKNVVNPNDAAVFITTSNDEEVWEKGVAINGSTATVRNMYSGKQRSKSVTVKDLEALVGPPLRAAIVWEQSTLMDPRQAIARWAGSAVANTYRQALPNASSPAGGPALRNWIWYLKRWACQSLVAADPHGPYDVVVSTRPDISFFTPYRFAVHHHKSIPFSLTIGDEAPLNFGEGEILMHAISLQCTNDWLAISTMPTSTTLEQIVHHGHSSNAFRSYSARDCQTGVMHAFTEGFCCEALLSAWLYRAGLRRHRTNLHVVLTKYVPKLLSADPQNVVQPMIPDPRAPNSSYNEDVLRIAMRWLLAEVNSGNEIICDRLPELVHFGATGVMKPYHVNRQDRSGAALRAPGDPRPWPSCNKTQINIKTIIEQPASACKMQQIPSCTNSVNLLRPLPTCVRSTLNDTVTDVTGFGVAFPWWYSCEGPCWPLPNVSFKFDGVSLEQAIVFPHLGRARKGSDEPEGGVVFETPG